MFNEEARQKGLDAYGPRQNVSFKDKGFESTCDCGHGPNDHNSSGTGKACDKCGCGVFHGIEAKPEGTDKLGEQFVSTY